MPTKPITEATPSELAEFARVHLGVDEVDHRLGAEKIIAKIRATNYEKDTIEVEDKKAAKAAASPQKTEDGPRKMVRIMIPSTDGVGGKEPVPVGCNGVFATIKRDVEVDVPIEYVNVLRDAKATRYDRGPNGELINPREVQTYVVNILSAA